MDRRRGHAECLWCHLAPLFQETDRDVPPTLADNIEVAWPAMREHLGALLDHPPGRRVVDLGCGSGWMSRRLRALGFDVTGIEDCTGMLGGAKDVEVLRVVQGDHAELERLVGPIDAILSCMVLQFVENIDELLTAVTRRLRPFGVFVFAVHRPEFVFACSAAGWLLTTDRPGRASMEINGVQVPLYVRTAEDYRRRCEAHGLLFRDQTQPPFPPEFFAKYGSDWRVTDPEFLVMSFQRDDSA